MKNKQSKGQWYCYLNGSCAIFLNRWDQVIKEFETYEAAEKYANENIHLIDERI